MKRLVLVRHGKSSWKNDLPDEKRPLKKRGYKDGKLICGFMKEFHQDPATLWTSKAVRAYETAKIFQKGLGIPETAFNIKDELYTFEGSELVKIIKSCEDSVEQLFVFCHNPAITNVVNRLGSKIFDNVPTTGLNVIDFDVNHWKEIKNGETILTLFPKNLR